MSFYIVAHIVFDESELKSVDIVDENQVFTTDTLEKNIRDLNPNFYIKIMVEKCNGPNDNCFGLSNGTYCRLIFDKVVANGTLANGDFLKMGATASASPTNAIEEFKKLIVNALSPKKSIKVFKQLIAEALQSVSPVPEVNPGDESVKAEDESVKAGDESVKAGDESVKSGDESVKSGDESVKSGDESVKSESVESESVKSEVNPGDEYDWDFGSSDSSNIFGNAFDPEVIKQAEEEAKAKSEAEAKRLQAEAEAKRLQAEAEAEAEAKPKEPSKKTLENNPQINDGKTYFIKSTKNP